MNRRSFFSGLLSTSASAIAVKPHDTANHLRVYDMYSPRCGGCGCDLAVLSRHEWRTAMKSYRVMCPNENCSQYNQMLEASPMYTNAKAIGKPGDWYYNFADLTIRNKLTGEVLPQ